jgi:hypothetical protein
MKRGKAISVRCAAFRAARFFHYYSVKVNKTGTYTPLQYFPAAYFYAKIAPKKRKNARNAGDS